MMFLSWFWPCTYEMMSWLDPLGFMIPSLTIFAPAWKRWSATYEVVIINHCKYWKLCLYPSPPACPWRWSASRWPSRWRPRTWGHTRRRGRPRGPPPAPGTDHSHRWKIKFWGQSRRMEWNAQIYPDSEAPSCDMKYLSYVQSTYISHISSSQCNGANDSKIC